MIHIVQVLINQVLDTKKLGLQNRFLRPLLFGLKLKSIHRIFWVDLRLVPCVPQSATFTYMSKLINCKKIIGLIWLTYSLNVLKNYKMWTFPTARSTLHAIHIYLYCELNVATPSRKWVEPWTDYFYQDLELPSPYKMYAGLLILLKKRSVGCC